MMTDGDGGTNRYDPFLPTALHSEPSGGMHYIFKNFTGKHISSRMNCPAPGIDVRGDGGYIVVVPSIINGIAYTMDGYSVAEAPAWLPDVIDSVPINLDIQDGSIKGNSRKAFLFGVALECRRNGMTLEHAGQRILNANTKCSPVFEMKELDIYLGIAIRKRGEQWLNDKDA